MAGSVALRTAGRVQGWQSAGPTLCLGGAPRAPRMRTRPWPCAAASWSWSGPARAHLSCQVGRISGAQRPIDGGLSMAIFPGTPVRPRAHQVPSNPGPCPPGAPRQGRPQLVLWDARRQGHRPQGHTSPSPALVIAALLMSQMLVASTQSLQEQGAHRCTERHFLGGSSGLR